MHGFSCYRRVEYLSVSVAFSILHILRARGLKKIALFIRHFDTREKFLNSTPQFDRNRPFIR